MPSRNIVEIVIKAVGKGLETFSTTAKNLTNLEKITHSAQGAMGRLNSASEAYHSTLQRLNPAGDQFAGMITKVVAAVGGYQVVKGIVEAASSFENYGIQLKTITGSAEAAQKAMDWITAFTAKTPYELDQVTEAFVQLQSRGFDATKVLGFLGDTASAMGKPLSQAVEAFTDAATGEFERLKEFGVTASSTADQVTFSWTENGKQVSETIQKTQGEIAGFLQDLWTKRFGGGMDAFAKSFKGLLSNLMDQVTLFYKRIADAGAFDVLKGKIASILETVEKMSADGTLAAWAKKVSDTFINLMDAAYRVGKVLASVGEAIAPYLPALLEYGSYLVGISLGLKLIVGLPKSIYTHISALNSAFKAMTGLGVVGWLGGVTGALTALGVVLVTGWAIKKILELIDLMKQLADTQKQAQAVSDKYRVMAKEFEAYKDFEIRGRKELMLMEDNELRKYAEFLQNKLRYWNRYRASLEAAKPEAEWIQDGEFGYWDTSALDAWQKEMDGANRQLGEIETAMGEMGEVARTNQVDLDAQSTALDRTGQAAANAAQKTKASAEDIRHSVENIGRNANLQMTELGKAYDFAAERAKALATDEKAGKAAAMEIYRQKAETMIGEAQRAYAMQKKALDQLPKDDKTRADLEKQIERDLSSVRISALDAWRSHVQSAYNGAIADARRYEAEVKRIEGERATNARTTNDMVRNIRRMDMTEEQAWWDRRSQAYEHLRQAQRDIAQAESPDQLQRAQELAEQARQEFAGLAGEVKDGDKTVISMAKSVITATAGVKEAGKTIDAALQKRSELTKKQQEEATALAQTWDDQLQKIQTRMEEISKTTMKPTAEFQVEAEEVKAKITELANTTVHIPVVFDVPDTPTPEGHTGGRVSEFHSGGATNGSKNFFGSLFRLKPGEIMAKLLKSEFVFSPAATRFWGVDFLDAMNNMKLSLPDLVSLATSKLKSYHSGGMVQALDNLVSSGIPKVPEIAPFAAASGATSASVETIVWRHLIGDSEFPLTVVGPNSKDTIKTLERELQKRRLTRA